MEGVVERRSSGSSDHDHAALAERSMIAPGASDPSSRLDNSGNAMDGLGGLGVEIARVGRAAGRSD